MSPQTQGSDLPWKGYAIHDTKDWDKFKLIDFEPKKMEDHDVDIKIAFCGVCGSDVHTITGGWGEPLLPLITGHEIVGHVVHVGPKVTKFKKGDPVGVGPSVRSCFECQPCKAQNENYCPKQVPTYNGKYPNGDIAHGGYATAIRAHEHFVIPIPKELPLDQAAPMLCAGVTVYSPLKWNDAGPGKCVGVIGVGGLGHYAIQFARAFGVEQVVVFSHSENKKDDAFKLGATDFVLTGDENFEKPWQGKIDLIICTADVSKGIPLAGLLSTLAIHGRIIVVSIPDDNLPPIHAAQLYTNGALIGGSHTGSIKETIEMLDLAVKKGVKSYIEVLPMKDAGKAVRDVKNNTVRYRHVLKVDI